MTCTIEKVFDVKKNIVAFFDDNIVPYVKKIGRTKLGEVEIVASENGRSHAFSAIVNTKIPKEKLEGLTINFN